MGPQEIVVGLVVHIPFGEPFGCMPIIAGVEFVPDRSAWGNVEYIRSSCSPSHCRDRVVGGGQYYLDFISILVNR